MLNRHKWLLAYARPYVGGLAVVLVVSLISTALSLSYPFFTSLLIDEVLIRQTRSLLNVLLLAFGSMFLGYMLSAGNSLLYLYITLSMLRDLRGEIFLRVQKAQYSHLLKTKVGDIISRLNGDAAEVQSGITDVVLQMLIQVCTLSFVAGMMVWLDWKLALACFAFAPFLIWTVHYFRPKIVGLTLAIRQMNSELQSFMIERLHAIKVVKLHSAEKRTVNEFKQQITELNTKSLHYSGISTLAEGIPRLVIMMTSMLVFAWGGHLVLIDELSIGALVAFTGYQARMYSPVQSLAALYLRIHRMGVSVKRLEELFHAPQEEQGRGNLSSQDASNDMLLEFRHVYYSHQGQSTLLQNINAQLQAGQFVALSGDSGRGKSTLIDLVGGFFEPTGGEIYFAGKELREYPLQDLRTRIAVASQQSPLFHVSVLDNIRFSNQKATEEQVQQAAILAEIHEEIMRLPEGYQTVIGERGMALSGGQRQRVALARTLLQQADLYILDEATSEVDEWTEQEIYKNLQRQRGKCSFIIISHRSNALHWVDETWILQEGRLFRKGGFNERTRSG